MDLAFGFISENINDGGSRLTYAHENITLPVRSKLVCTVDELAKLKANFKKTDFKESCSRKGKNTKWRFYKLTNLTVFAKLLKVVPMGCRDAALPDPLLKS